MFTKTCLFKRTLLYICTATILLILSFTLQFQDRYAERNGYPVEDTSQDVQLLSGSEVNGVTTIKFTRKHNTCDDKDMVVGVR